MASAQGTFEDPVCCGDTIETSNEYVASTKVPRKRKETMATSTHAEASCQKRARKIPEWQAMVEQLTPEYCLSVVEPAPVREEFLPGQFELQDHRSKSIQETETVDALTVLLERTCTANTSLRFHLGKRGPYRSPRYPDGSSSIFFSLKKPSVVLRNYITRLVRYMHVSKSVFIVALIYLDRLRQEDELLSLNDLNVHRLLTTAIALAAKYLEDESHRNSTVARIGGVPSTVEMNMLEVQFLRRLRWNCAVSQVAFEHYERTALGVSRAALSSTAISDVSAKSLEGEGQEF